MQLLTEYFNRHFLFGKFKTKVETYTLIVIYSNIALRSAN